MAPKPARPATPSERLAAGLPVEPAEPTIRDLIDAVVCALARNEHECWTTALSLRAKTACRALVARLEREGGR